MQLEPVVKHIKKNQEKRAKLFVQSLRFIDDYYRNSRNYYLVMLFLSLIIVLADLSLFFSFESEVFTKASLLLGSFSFLFSLVKFLNLSEKSSEKIRDIFVDLDSKYKEENEIIKNFYAGKIEEKNIRNFYLRKNLSVDKKYFGNGEEVVLRWLDLIVFSLAMVLILFNFF